jgi:hypothetical protein
VSDAYELVDVLAMFNQPIRDDLGSSSGSTLVALGSELRGYLRTAPGRRFASPAKVSLGIAVLDIWTGFSSDLDQARYPQPAESAAFATIGAATALLTTAMSDARELILVARERIERAIENVPDLQEQWLVSTEIGTETGFYLDIEARRAERVWRALVTFDADAAPVALSANSSRMIQLLRDVKARLGATELTKIAEVKTSWPTAPLIYPSSGQVTAGGAIFEQVEVGEAVGPWESLEHVSSDGGAQRRLIWFGTNRMPTKQNDVTSTYSNEIAPDKLFYGYCQVNIPVVGDVSGGLHPLFSRWLRRGSVHASRPNIDSYYRFSSQADFINELQSHLAAGEAEVRTALVFIHGYNTNFNQAVVSAAQLSANINHHGPTAIFSWPSRANFVKYRHDRRMIDASRPQLLEFLQTIQSITEVDHVDVVAHSLGNQLLLDSLVDWFRHVSPTSIPLRNLFLGAPDIAQTEFLSKVSVYAQAAQKTTLYGSDSDAALICSKVLNQNPRVGLMPPIALATGIDTIESSRVDLSCVGHNAITNARAIQTDIFLVQGGILSPDNRPFLQRVGSPPHIPYWRF